MAPVRSKERIEVIDILRGVSILGVVLMNMGAYAGYHTPLPEMGTINHLVMWLLKFLVQAKFYTLLSFLFGWGMAVQMARAASRGTRFVPFYVRRLLALLLIGLVHAILIWDGDILVTYALLGFPLLLFRKRSDRTLLVAAVLCILIPVLISTPGPAASLREAHARATENYLQAMLAGRSANVLAEGSYLEATLHRLKSLRFGYSQFIYWATHVFGMFLLGLYAGRRRIFQNIPAHLPLFRKVMWWGLIVGLACNLVFVSVAASPDRVPSSYYELATRGARTIGGPALCLFYISAIVLLIQKRTWYERLYPFAAVGRMAMSNYLSQSVVCTLIFYGYGLGIYGHLGPAITLILSLVIYRLQISLSDWWLDRYRFGPAEWLWRSLTYGKFQPLKRERGDRRYSPSTLSSPPSTLPSPLASLSSPLSTLYSVVLRRLAFIVVVAFAIVYFCVLGMRLSPNSTTMGRPRSVWELAEPALEETTGFFADAFQGDLGHISRGITRRAWVPVTELLADTFAKSVSLLAVSVALATTFGIAAGGLAAARRHSILALPTLTLTVIGVSIPSFLLALLLQVADIKFYQYTGGGLFSIHGISGYRRDLLPRIIAPALVLAARPLAHITRVTFVSISEILNRDFIRTARAKGLDQRAVFWRHTLRNTGVSVLTAVVVSLRFALASLPVVEIFFNWPGLGVMMLNGIYQREVKAVAALALSLGVTFLLINLASDLCYRIIEPRLRAPANGGGA
ncbi:MAG: DUF418 domain-containing protein [Anaerolineae bacterium]|nr:DUF418 domain-containing protein [Anaerolineae bacterium]